MSGATAFWVDAVVAALVATSGLLCLAAAVGLVRLARVFERLHVPSLASTVGVWTMALASLVHLSASDAEPQLHPWLIAIVMSITAPVTTTLLARAALFRLRQRGDAELPPPLGHDEA